MATRIRVRRDTSANWASENPVLLSGEFGFDTDTGEVKVGNGTDTWDDLVALGMGGGAVDSVNGDTGVVVLTAADVGADPAGTAASAIAALVDSAPGTLNTLNELAAALGDDPNLATTLTNAIAAKAADADVVHDNGNETIAGVKTFSSSPIVPAPTTDLQAATKKYVDDNAGGAVDSVNGDTGTVVLTAADVNARPWPEGVVTVASSGSTETLTPTAAETVFDITLTAAIVTFTFAGAVTSGVEYSFTLYARQDATGGRLATWPGSVSWGSAGAPTLSTAGDAVDIFTFTTVDGGTTWFGFASSASSSGGGGLSGVGYAVKQVGSYIQAVNGSGAGSNCTLTTGTAYAVPVFLRAGTLSGIGAQIGTAQASTSLRIGLYATDANGMPSSLVVEAGTPIDGSTTGAKIATVSQVITAGQYWGVVAQNTGTALVIAGFQNENALASFVASASQSSSHSAYTQTGVTGALPSNFGTPAATTNIVIPKFWVRYSA